MADIDEIQTLGEVALKTLTQLWRQLPRLDHEAGKKLGDEVANARKAIEKLVRIGCEAQMTSISLGAGDEKKLYEPLPFTSGQHSRANRQNQPGGHVSPSRSDSSMSRSPSGMQKLRPAFPHRTGGGGARGEIELDEELNSSSTNDFLLSGVDPNAETAVAGSNKNSNNNNGKPAKLPKSPSSFSKRTVQDNGKNNNNTFLDEAAIAADYERFKRDLGLPAGLNYYDDPAWIEMMKQYSGTPNAAHNMAPSRLSLMVQLALRRELMWRLHARMLQMQSDRDSLGEIETKDRCEIEIECAEAREEMVAQMQGVKLMLVDDEDDGDGDDEHGDDRKEGRKYNSSSEAGGDECLEASTTSINSLMMMSSPGGSKKKSNNKNSSAKSKKALVFDNIRRSFQREQDMKEMNQKCEKMDDEKTKLADEVSKLTKEVMKLAKENTSLTKKAASPSQALHPDQLAGVLEEIAKLRRQVNAQEEELQALGV